MQYLKSGNTAPCLEKLTGIVQTGLYGSKRFRDPVIVAFSDGIPVETAENFVGRIRMGSCGCMAAEVSVSESEGMFSRSLIRRVKEKWQIIDHTISQLSAGEEFQTLLRKSPGTEVWYTVMCILKALPELSGEAFSEGQVCLERIETAGVQIIKEWDMEQVSGDWCEIFRNQMFAAVKDIPGILNKGNLKKEDVESRQEWPLCDETFYYIPEELFRRICSGIKATDASQVKQILAAQGVIRAEGKQRLYYTIKVNLVTAEHDIYSPRMIWIYRDKVDLPGRMTWEDRIRMEGGEP